MSNDINRELFRAICEGDTVTIQRLIQSGINPHARNRDGMSFLERAADVGNIEAVHLLLDHGIGLDEPMPLQTAAENGDPEIVSLFIARGADVNAPDDRGWTPLIEAAYWGNLKAIRLLLQHGADPHRKTVHGFTALALAEQEGHTEVALFLKETGVSK